MDKLTETPSSWSGPSSTVAETLPKPRAPLSRFESEKNHNLSDQSELAMTATGLWVAPTPSLILRPSKIDTNIPARAIIARVVIRENGRRLDVSWTSPSSPSSGFREVRIVPWLLHFIRGVA